MTPTVDAADGGAIGSIVVLLPAIWSWDPTGGAAVGNRVLERRLAKRGWYSVVPLVLLLVESVDDDRWRPLVLL
jgi:hypothetical protein